MIIKRLNKLYHVVDGNDTVLITSCFDEATRLMPKDDKVYENKSLENELLMEYNDIPLNRNNRDFDGSNSIKNVYEFKKLIGKRK